MSTQSFNNIFVFDTNALFAFSQNKGRSDWEKAWRNNAILGDCFVPGATFAEINNFYEQSGTSTDKDKARAFLGFLNKEGKKKNRHGYRYQIEPNHDNNNIPIDQEKDRQIVACAHRIAQENSKSAVILVTYDLKLQVLSEFSGMNNFCNITSKELAIWFHQRELPTDVSKVYEKLKKAPFRGTGESRPLPPGRRVTRSLPTERTNKPTPPKRPRIVKKPVKPPALPPSLSEPPPPSDPNINRASSTKTDFLQSKVFLGLCGLITIIILAFFYSSYRETNSPESGISTPSELLSASDTAIKNYQQTKEVKYLTDAIERLEAFQEDNSEYLDKDGQYKLCTIRYKYAIEQLASYGQKAAAVDQLRWIPALCPEYNGAQKWLKKNGY